ncbi:MAG: hypothetical protein H7A53_10145 [Akkermansiaceae bacterium]|nr:hypothetical protein [Akkermansiaceae bacterium]
MKWIDRLTFFVLGLLVATVLLIWMGRHRPEKSSSVPIRAGLVREPAPEAVPPRTGPSPVEMPEPGGEISPTLFPPAAAAEPPEANTPAGYDDPAEMWLAGYELIREADQFWEAVLLGRSQLRQAKPRQNFARDFPEFHPDRGKSPLENAGTAFQKTS